MAGSSDWVEEIAISWEIQRERERVDERDF